MNSLLIAGCGYLGHRVAQRWLSKGRKVTAVTRRPEQARQFTQSGMSTVVGDVTQPSSLQEIPPADTILFAVGFDRSTGDSIEDVYVSGLANFLAALPERPQRFIYISSTGVYGQTDGSWVDEDSDCQPTRAGGKACLAAEKLLMGSDLADRVVILRCAGLYGPGRIPRLDDLAAGQPIPAHSDVWLNMIHIDDVAEIVCSVADTPPPSKLYLVGDGHPVTRRDFYDYFAKRSGYPSPKFAPPDASDTSRRAGGDNKCVNNKRLMREVQPQLKYPTYREGLDAIET